MGGSSAAGTHRRTQGGRAAARGSHRLIYSRCSGAAGERLVGGTSCVVDERGRPKHSIVFG